MKSKVFKILVPILVLAMLLQVPFAISASAADLATDTQYSFTVSKAPSGKAGDTQVVCKITGTAGAGELSAIGATLVVKTSQFDLVDKNGNVVTSTYKTDSKALPNTVAVEYADFIGVNQTSIASYNAANDEMYIFISAILIDEEDDEHGIEVADDTVFATLYLKSIDGAKPSDENMRVMKSEEFRTTCPGKGVYPAAVSAKSGTLVKAETDGVTNATIAFELNGSIKGTGVVLNNESRNASVVLKKDGTQVASTTTNAGVFEFLDVEPGVYTIEISAPGALTFTVKNVEVVANTQNLIDDTIALLFGNADGDASIGSLDISVIITNIGNDSAIACDADGDGTVGALDISVILTASHFGVSEDTQVLDKA